MFKKLTSFKGHSIHMCYDGMLFQSFSLFEKIALSRTSVVFLLHDYLPLYDGLMFYIAL